RVSRTAERADFPHPLGADAADRQVGHAAAFEAKPGVGDIFGRAEYRNAHRVHTHDGRLDEGQDDIEIVNHEIEHHADIGAARGVRREAVGLNEARFGGHGCELLEDGVEALDLPDLEDAAVLPGQLD